MLGYLVKKGDSNKVTTNVSIPYTLSAPIESGQKIGEVTHSIDGKTIATTNIVAKENIKKLNFGNMVSRVLEYWFTLLR